MSIGANIQEVWLKVKYGFEVAIGEWGLILVVLLVALSSFGLGRLSAGEASKPAVSVSVAPMEAEPKGMAIGGLVVASRNGSVYQYPWCGGAANIKPENQVWFKTEEAAKAAGYAPAKNCKGLGTAQ
ncbi:MAG: Ada metal-binding domain-containing protein [Patescibacteria group bacterium]